MVLNNEEIRIIMKNKFIPYEKILKRKLSPEELLQITNILLEEQKNIEHNYNTVMKQLRSEREISHIVNANFIESNYENHLDNYDEFIRLLTPKIKKRLKNGFQHYSTDFVAHLTASVTFEIADGDVINETEIILHFLMIDLLTHYKLTM